MTVILRTQSDIVLRSKGGGQCGSLGNEIKERRCGKDGIQGKGPLLQIMRILLILHILSYHVSVQICPPPATGCQSYFPSHALRGSRSLRLWHTQHTDPLLSASRSFRRGLLWHDIDAANVLGL